MSIERLSLEDRATVEELWLMQHAAYRREAALIGVADLPPLRDTVQSLQQCGETFYGFRAPNGDLAGAVSIEEETTGRTVICRMMVHPDHVRQGIGSMLLQHVLGQLAAGSEVTVTAEIRNLPAIRLYERHGFESVAALKPSPDITMMRYVRKIT